MRLTIAILLIFLLSGILLIGPAYTSQKPLDVPIKHLRTAPADNAEVVFDIPIEVKLLEIGEDLNWYKVKISFYIGPFCYNYVGWTKIPIEQILAEEALGEPDLAKTPEK